MLTNKKVFSGRIIFDHLPKTAGQAINAWLLKTLGSGCVSPNLIGDHHDLIRRYGGLYSIISGHTYFHHAEGLDPRYQYITLLRNPTDRAISWLYFLLNNHDDSQIAGLRDAAKRFLDSDGLDADDVFIASISNVYVEHFCRILGTEFDSDDEKLSNSIAAVSQYDVVGLYENLPGFLADVSALISIPAPDSLIPINVTVERPKVDQISLTLRERIDSLNQLDWRLYENIVENCKKNTAAANKRLLSSASSWVVFERDLNRTVDTSDVTIDAAVIREGYDIRSGQLMTFDIDFSLSRDLVDLEMGIHLFDEERRWAFGINSTLLGHTFSQISEGTYRVSYYLLADLPSGKYTAGFAFAERLSDGSQRDLAWRDVMCEFEVFRRVSKKFAGYAYVPTEMSLSSTQVPSRYSILADDPRLFSAVGERSHQCIATTSRAGFLLYGPYVVLAKGEYQVRIKCSVGSKGLAGAWIDVVSDGSNTVFIKCDFELPDAHGYFRTGLVSLDVLCKNLEVRIWVEENTDLQIYAVEIMPWSFDGALSRFGSEVPITARLARVSDTEIARI